MKKVYISLCAGTTIIILLTAVLLAARDSSEKESMFPPGQVIQLLNSVGIPAQSAAFMHRTQMGKRPQIPQDVCMYRVNWEDAEWELGVDACTHKLVKLWGQTAFTLRGKSQRIKGYEEALRITDEWFRRFGIDDKAMVVTSIEKVISGGRAVWRVERWRCISPNVYVRTVAAVDLDEATGGLIGFNLDPDIAIPEQLPKPSISANKAIELASARIESVKTEHYEPSKDLHLIDCVQLFTWKGTSDNRVLFHTWRLRFYGNAKQISYLPSEYQKLKPPKVVPVLWDVFVDAQTGNCEIHHAINQNELFNGERLYKW